MKFFKALTLLCILALSSITSFQLTVFGDPGQFNRLFPLAIPAPIKTGAKVPRTSTPLTSPDCRIGGQGIDKMSNWEGVLKSMSEFIKKSDQSVVLGDMVYTESKFATVKFNKGFWIPLEDNQDPETYWRERLRCSWSAFFQITKKSLLGINKKFLEDENKFSTAFQLLPGNHLYDINPQDETKLMNKMSMEDEQFTWYPEFSDWLNGVRLQKIEEKEQIIYFLDFNSAVFEAVSSKNEIIYDGSSATILDDIEANIVDSWWNLDGVTKDDIFSTLEGLFTALKAMEKETNNKATIRVVRAHHPPFNVEGDVTGMFQYKSKLNGFTFMEACRKANVNFYFASHHHSSKIWAFDYSKVSSLTGKGTRLPQDNFKLNGAKDPKKNYDCFPNNCSPFSLTTGINLVSQKYLYVILIGNSGRYFDPMNPDTNSYGTLLFGRARNNNPNKNVMDRWKANHAGNAYGGAVVNFETKHSQTIINVDIYESNNGIADNVGSLKLSTGVSEDINGFVSHAPNNRLKKRLF